MTLGEYIEVLEGEQPLLILPIGFASPHSWRGVYEDLAFVIEKDVSVRLMLNAAKDCIGKTFTGYQASDLRKVA